MKKSLKPVLLFILLLFSSIALIILGYVGVKLECEFLIKEKVFAQERLNTALNKKIDFTARQQLLTNEERITSLASEVLGLVKDTSSVLSISVPTTDIARIEELLEDSYE